MREVEDQPVQDDVNIGLGLSLALRDKSKPAPIASCPRDGAPLIGTCIFSGAEFYCLDCGGKFGFLSPRPLESNPENDARLKEYEAEWNDNVAGKILVGYRRDNASEEAMAADKEARDWIRERVKS